MVNAPSIPKIVTRGDVSGNVESLPVTCAPPSLTDLYFHPMNGNASSIIEAERLQEHFATLSGMAYRLAYGLRHAAEE